MSERPDPLAPPEDYGRKPGQEPEPVISAVCTFNNGQCTAPSAVQAKLGCLGEHIAELYYCASHWAQVSAGGRGFTCYGRDAEGRYCGQAMRVELVSMLTDDAARQVAAEIVKIRGADSAAIQGALDWAHNGRPDAWYRPVWTEHGYEMPEPPPDDGPQLSGLERVREAVRRARGGDPPASPQGYA